MGDFLAALALSLPYRCRDCRYRFFSRDERLHSMRYAHCPRCGTFDLEVIAAHKVPARGLSRATRLLHRRAYRCDSCRWRFFDMRPLPPKQAPPPAATGQASAGPPAENRTKTG